MWQVLTTLDGPNDEGMRRRWEVNVAELLELWPLALQQHLPLLEPRHDLDEPVVSLAE